MVELEKMVSVMNLEKGDYIISRKDLPFEEETKYHKPSLMPNQPYKILGVRLKVEVSIDLSLVKEDKKKEEYICPKKTNFNLYDIKQVYLSVEGKYANEETYYPLDRYFQIPMENNKEKSSPNVCYGAMFNGPY